jgi:hypothetical protein
MCAPVASSREPSPLLVALVEKKGRLLSIYTELKGWQHKADERRRGGLAYKYEDFGELDPGGENRPLDNYYQVAQKAGQVILAKLGYCGDVAYKKFKNYKVVAAYDRSGNLQGVTVAKIVDKKGVAAKVDFLVTAFWNMPFKGPKNSIRTRGAGTCLLQRLTEIVPEKGALFLEPVAEAVEFYAKNFFKEIPGWQPKTEGAWCGMALSRKDFALLKGQTKDQLTSCEESELPYTQKHYLRYSPEYIQKRANDGKD